MSDHVTLIYVIAIIKEKERHLIYIFQIKGHICVNYIFLKKINICQVSFEVKKHVHCILIFGDLIVHGILFQSQDTQLASNIGMLLK